MDLQDTLRLHAHGDRALHIERLFAAPPKLVRRALLEPDLIRRWLKGPPGWEMTECAVEARVGGAFRYRWRGPDGEDMAMSGAFSELGATRIAHTERFEFGCEAQAGEQVAATELVAEDGDRTTLLRIEVLYPSAEARDGAIASGMEQGLAASYALLDALFEGAELRR